MEEKETSYHVPVMLDESVKGLNIQEGGYLRGCDLRRWRTFTRNPETDG